MKTLDEIPFIDWPDKPGLWLVRGNCLDASSRFTIPKPMTKTVHLRSNFWTGEILEHSTYDWLRSELGYRLEFFFLEDL